MTEETGEWLECVVNNDYEIFSEYPYPIRRKGSDKVVKERIDPNCGYVLCSLNAKGYRKHRLIAQQFIPNPDASFFKEFDVNEYNKINREINFKNS